MAAGSEVFYITSGRSGAQPTLFGDRILGLWGIKIDMVSDFHTREAGLPGTLRKWWDNSEAYWNTHEEPSTPYPNGGGGWQDAFSRTVLCDLIAPINEAPVAYGKTGAWRRARRQDIDLFKTLISELRLSSSSIFVPKFSEASLTEKELWLTLSRINTESRGYFITSKKYTGLGPETLREGDEVWVLMGSPVPFILRPLVVKDSSDKLVEMHILVGYCFVHGIMDGEAIKNFLHDVELVSLTVLESHR